MAVALEGRVLQFVDAGHRLGPVRVGERKQVRRAVEDALGHEMGDAFDAFLHPALDQHQPRAELLALVALQLVGLEIVADDARDVRKHVALRVIGAEAGKKVGIVVDLDPFRIIVVDIVGIARDGDAAEARRLADDARRRRKPAMRGSLLSER